MVLMNLFAGPELRGTHIEQTLNTVGEGEGNMSQESSTDIYTQSCVK